MRGFVGHRQFAGGHSARSRSPIFIDNFDGALDTALQDHTSDSGHTWTQRSGSMALTGSGGLKDTSAGISGYTYESGTNEGYFRFTLLGEAEDHGLFLRYVDGSNYIWCEVDDSDMGIWVNVAGTLTEEANAAVTPGDGQVAEILLSGTNISFRLEGVEITHSTASHQASTIHGIRADSSANDLCQNITQYRLSDSFY